MNTPLGRKRLLKVKGRPYQMYVSTYVSVKCLAHARACECVYPLLYETAYKREKMPQDMYTHMLACWMYAPLSRQVVLVRFDIWHI